MRMILSPVFLALLLALASCGDDGESGGGVGCDTVPSCYLEAMTDLGGCLTTTELTLGSVSANSGVVKGLVCSATDLHVGFSDFSERQNGTVPIPSRVTITSGANLCAELSRSSDGRITIERPGKGDVSVAQGKGEIYISCTGDAGGVFTAQNSALSECPAAVQTMEITRNADITEVAVRLHNADETQEDLFLCR